MADVPTTEHLAGAGIDPDDIKRARGYLLLRRLSGDITDDEMSEIGQALGLFEHPDVQAREPRGHIKGTKGRLRAVPVDWTRRGAVGIGG